MAMLPLLGDGNGTFRVKIVGNCGAGKSTLARRLATDLQVEFVSLDHVHWQPGWVETPAPEFRQKIRDILGELYGSGWVVDGCYAHKLADIVDELATDIIWLDPPLVLSFPRLALRTVLRMFFLAEPCSPGSVESIRLTFFSPESVLWYALTNHSPKRRHFEAQMLVVGVRIDSCGAVAGKMRRIGGWGGELRTWYAEVEQVLGRGR